MSFNNRAFALALVTTMAMPAQAWAFGGGGGGAGCSDLPDYARAAGALEGLSSCDMSIDEARRIVAAHDGQAYQQAAPDPQVRHRHHRVRTPQQ